jgi:subfamily B ATP-binding cassette protein HlyB/CyaB
MWGTAMSAATVLGSIAPFEPEGAQEPSGLACLVIVARHYGLHLSVPQIIRNNVLTSKEVSVAELVKCAESEGLKAKPVTLAWSDLRELRRALPVIVRLKNGSHMVLRQFDDEFDPPRIVLQDPNADEDAFLVLDQVRFEEVWGGDIIVIKRNYELTDETQPFSVRLIISLMFRERRIARDIFLCAVMLGLLALAPILFWRLLMDKVLFYKAFNTFFVLCLAMAVVVVFETAFVAIRQYLVSHLVMRIDVRLSTQIFYNLLNLPIDFFERTQVGLIARDIRELWKIRRFLTEQVLGTALDAALLFFFLPVMFFFSPIITVVVLAMCGAIAAWLIVMLPVYRRKTAAVHAVEGQQGAFLVQTLTGMRTVKSLALEARYRHIWDVYVAQTAKLRFAESMTANLIQTVARPMERLAVSGSLALAVYLALTSSDTLYAGALFAFVMLTQRVVAPLLQLSQMVSSYDEARTAAYVIAKLVNQPPEEGRSGHGVRRTLEGNIQFSNVTFKYKGAVSPALEQVSFEVAPGTTLGVMGRSGSGKTTITRLLQRLHSEYDGLIKIDGVDVREYDVEHLRHSLGVVLQENFLFSGTIRENITAGKSDATFDEIVRAARMAGAEEFIDKLPRGYETYVYEGSPNLSGGQRQRLAIARALILDPRVLIFDEATSALDAESEAIVNANISRIARGRTLIIISHRLSSLVSADAILVLDRGRVNDIGKHEELLDRCDIYSNLWHQQNQHVGSRSRRDLPSFRGPSLVS